MDKFTLGISLGFKGVTRSFTITNDNDYSSPGYDMAWHKSKLKLQPILSSNSHRGSHSDSDLDTHHSNQSLSSLRRPVSRQLQELRRRDLVLAQHVINVPIQSLTMLLIKPGEKHFLIWYLISMYFPLITACMGPIANLISFVGLIEPWRIDRASNKSVHDVGFYFAFNISLLVLGLMGNISLLMNFSGRVRYLVSQSILIFCWLTACLMLTSAVAVAKVKFFDEQYDIYRPSEGYFFAIFTAGMYFLCLLILIINFAGYRLKKYPPTFNLGPKQRSLMIFTICLAIWLLCGAILFAHIIPSGSYGLLLYFCTVSVLTIGLGDIVPLSAGAKVLSLLFSLVGVLILGLIITMIRQVVLASGGPTIFWHMIERERHKELETELINSSITQEELYKRMRQIRRNMQNRQRRVSLLLTLLNFVAFWLIGATVFYFTEGWNYFNAFYFCFLCLITIGYGDYHPVSPLGRAFFVCWGIGAVPLMTILISNVGDHLFNFAVSLSFYMAKLFFPDYYKYLVARRKSHHVEDMDFGEEDVDSEEIQKKLILDQMDAQNLDQVEEHLAQDKDLGINTSEEINTLEGVEREEARRQEQKDLEETEDGDESVINAEQRIGTIDDEDAMDDVHEDMDEIQDAHDEVEQEIREDSGEFESIGSKSIDLKEGSTSESIENDSEYESSVNRFDPSLDASEEVEELEVDIHQQIHKVHKEAERLVQMFKMVASTLEDVLQQPDRKYDHEEWGYYLNKLSKKPSEDYWLSEESPLRLPLSEPRYLLTKFFAESKRSANHLSLELDILKAAEAKRIALEKKELDSKK